MDRWRRPDLEAFAVAAYAVGDDAGCLRSWERAHRAWLAENEPLREARCAFWAGFGLFYKGQMAQSQGWFGRAQRLVDAHGPESVERGLLAVPFARMALDEDAERAYKEFHLAERIGARDGDLDLMAFDRWVIASKYTLAMRPDDPNAAGNSRKNMRASVEASLRRLDTDHLDILFLHAWDYTTSVEEVMRGLDDLVRAGKALSIAFSDVPAWVAAQAGMLAALRGWSPLVALQFPYSLLERTVERELLPVADALGASVTSWAPLGAGILSGKYTRAASGLPVDSRRAAANADALTERNLRIAREVDFVADDIGATSAQVALAWTRSRSERIIPIVGVRTVEQLEDGLGSLDVTLTTEHRSQLDEVSRIELGFPYTLLAGNQGQMVYGDLEPAIDLPPAAAIRWARPFQEPSEN
jgi:aryl-alcohol dehydrogenase-like predicted oxidoreductase